MMVIQPTQTGSEQEKHEFNKWKWSWSHLSLVLEKNAMSLDMKSKATIWSQTECLIMGIRRHHEVSAILLKTLQASMVGNGGGSLLVGGLEHFLFFHILGIIIPIDKYFSEGFKPPTRLILGVVFLSNGVCDLQHSAVKERCQTHARLPSSWLT